MTWPVTLNMTMFSLAQRYITGLELSELCADITTFVGGGTCSGLGPGWWRYQLLTILPLFFGFWYQTNVVREPDDFNVLLRFKCGAKGVLIASQVVHLRFPPQGTLWTTNDFVVAVDLDGQRERPQDRGLR